MFTGEQSCRSTKTNGAEIALIIAGHMSRGDWTARCECVSQRNPGWWLYEKSFLLMILAQEILHRCCISAPTEVTSVSEGHYWLIDSLVKQKGLSLLVPPIPAVHQEGWTCEDSQLEGCPAARASSTAAAFAAHPGALVPSPRSSGLPWVSPGSAGTPRAARPALHVHVSTSPLPSGTASPSLPACSPAPPADSS